MSQLDNQRHVKYWQRCRNSYLPTAYTGNDSTRLTLACFTLCAYDLLSIPLTVQERAAIRTWVLSLQHPDGGFCGSPAHSHHGRRDAAKGTANIAATFFALVSLALAAEQDQARCAFLGVNRRGLLRWLGKLQRKDGSFGQNLWEGEPVGGTDMRHSYLASCIRWMMGGGQGEGDEEEGLDFGVERMVRHIRGVQTYDGGLSESLMDESHGGYAYCGISALSMLDRPLHSPPSSPVIHESRTLREGIADQDALLKFLAHRYFLYRAQEEEEDEDEENFVQEELSQMSLGEGCSQAGYNGRWNKKADTCYCWWAVGSLQILGHPEMINVEPSRRYLLDITQHAIGGFSKSAGGPPDIYHSYLGLASLAAMGQEDGLKEFDVRLCCSRETVRKIELARDELLKASKGADGL